MNIGSSEYTDVIAARTIFRETMIEADKGNSDDVYIKVINGSDEATHIEAGGAVTFSTNESWRGLEGKSASGTQTVRRVY